jgi:hypothetical protein
MEKKTPEQVAYLVKDIDKKQNRNYRQRADLAIDYLLGRQLDDCIREIYRRYPKTQQGGSGQLIEPVVIPVVNKFVAEAANLYNRPVRRKVVNIETGEANEEMTAELEHQLSVSDYNGKLHRIEQIIAVLGDAGLWFQAKQGKLHVSVTLPQVVHPISLNHTTEQSDLIGYVIELDSDPTKEQREFAFISQDGVWVYKGRCAGEPSGNMRHDENPFTFVQPQPTDDGRELLAESPLQMFTLWSDAEPIDGVMLQRDPDIVYVNRELNIQWSMLLDTIRIQGWDMTVATLLDPENGFRDIPHGSRFPVAVKLGESISKIGSSAPYGAIVDALKALSRSIAIAHRMSPNDFSIDAASPASGFAKLVDSLPKIEARQDRASRFRRLEETLAWPRIASIGEFLGWPGFTKQTILTHKMVTEFSEIEFPQTIDEQIKRDDHELKLGHTTEAKLLAKKRDISTEDAEAEIEENKAAQPEAEEMDEEGMGNTEEDRRPSLLGQLIGNPTSIKMKRGKDEGSKVS